MIFKQRLGKTYIAAGVVERLAPRRSLIIVPLTNKDSTWRLKLRELVPHIPLHMTRAKGRKRLLAVLDAFEEGILLLHYEEACAIIKQLCKREWDLIIVDEAHRAKDRASLFSRSLAKLRDSIGYRVILTGTPIEDRPQDLWAQMRFLHVELFGNSWPEFEREYMNTIKIDLKAKDERGRPKYPYKSVRWRRAILKMRMADRKAAMKSEMLPKFIELLKPYLWREELPGPEPRFHIIPVRMYGDQRRLYEEMRDTGAITVDGVEITAELLISKRVKMRQITSGFIYDNDGEVHWIGKAKMRALRHVLKILKPPVPIFCLYVPEIDYLLEALPGSVEALWGRTPRDQRAPVIKRFQLGKIDYLPCQTRTGGVGIDLYRAKSLVVVSSNYSSIDFDQLIARIRLPDQKDPVDIFLLCCIGTIDEERQGSVFAKGRRISSVMSQLRRTV